MCRHHSSRPWTPRERATFSMRLLRWRILKAQRAWMPASLPCMPRRSRSRAWVVKRACRRGRKWTRTCGRPKFDSHVRWLEISMLEFAPLRRAWVACAIVALLATAAHAAAPRKVIVDQDAFGPGGSDMQSILMALQAPNVDVLGITITSGDGWCDEEVQHTLRLLEVAQRTEVKVYPGAVYPLLNTQKRTLAWEKLYGR